MKFEFDLKKDSRSLGKIRWICGGDKQNGSVSGNAAAVVALTAAMERAVAEAWVGRYPPPSRVRVSDPTNYIRHMITVLEQGGFDMPSVLEPYTAKAEQEHPDMPDNIRELIRY